MTSGGPRRFERETDEFGRGVTFLDALFAFALTLLVTTLDVPDRTAWRSLATLRDAVGAQLFAFALSFVVIAAFWRAHHELLQRFVALDARLITWNLVLSATIVLLPFTTESLGATSEYGYPLPVAAYAINVAAAALSVTAISVHGLRADLLHDQADRRSMWAQAAAGLVLPGVFLVSVPIAFVFSAPAAQLTWIALFPLRLVAGRLVARRSRG